MKQTSAVWSILEPFGASWSWRQGSAPKLLSSTPALELVIYVFQLRARRGALYNFCISAALVLNEALALTALQARS